MEVLRDTGTKNRPVFRVTTDAGDQFDGPDPSACWNKVYRRIRKMHSSSSDNSQTEGASESFFKSGADMFGFSDPHVLKLIQEKIRIALYVQKAALQFIDAANRTEHKLSQQVIEAGYDIEPDDLAYIVRSHNNKTYDYHGGLQGLARKIKVSLRDGVLSGDISKRQQIFGCIVFLVNVL